MSNEPAAKVAGPPVVPRYAKKKVRVLGREMAYYEVGSGDPIVFVPPALRHPAGWQRPGEKEGVFWMQRCSSCSI